MRVLHVLAETGYSGGEQQLEHLVRYLHEQGHTNELVLAPGAKFAGVGSELGLRIHDVPLRRPFAPAMWSGTRRAVRAADPQVLHFGCGRSLLWAGLATRGLRVPLRITTRRIDYPIGRVPWRAMRYRRLVDHTAANCQSVRRRVLDAGVPEDRVTLVHEGIDVEPWRGAREGRDAARDLLALPGDAIVVSCAASLRPRKGQRILIEAFAGLVDEFPNAILILAGSGTDLEPLRAEVARRELGERILVPGVIKPVRDLYAASDLFVMPSYHEGLSNACLEASASGLPQIVSSVGGLPEIVEHGVTGEVVPPGDASALREALRRYLGDGTRRAKAGEAGRIRTAENFTARRMAEGMEALFERLLASASPQSR